MSVTLTSGGVHSQGLVAHWELSEASENRGSDLVINGTFDTDSDWTKQTGWTISGETANVNNTSGSSQILYQNNIIEEGKTYFVQYTISNYVSGTLRIYMGGSSAGTNRTANGTYSEVLPQDGNTIFQVIAFNNTQASIDNVIVKEIQAGDSTPNGNGGSIYGATYTAGPTAKGLGEDLVTNGTFDTDSDWTKGTGVSLSGGTANWDGSQTANSWLTQSGVVSTQIGKKYSVTYTISNYSAGEIWVDPGGYAGGVHRTANGTYTDSLIIASALSSSTFYISGNLDFVGSIDNVSAREVLSPQAMSFDGTDDYVDMGNDTSLQITGTVSVSAWFNTTSTSDYQGIVGKSSVSPYDGYALRVRNDGDLEMIQFVGGSSVPVDASGRYALASNTWYHAVGIITPTTSYLYVNGTLQAEYDSLGAVVDSGNDMYIGTYGYPSPTYDFSGQINNVRIYDRALSLAEIKNLYEGSSSSMSNGTLQKGLVGHWPLNKKSVQSDSRSLDNSSAGTSSVPSPQAYGTWEFDFYKDGDGNNTYNYFINNNTGSYSTSNGFYTIGSSTAEALILGKGSGNFTSIFVTTDSYIAMDTWYRIKVTRSTAGAFTVYIKGGAYGDIDGSTWTTVDPTGGSGTNPITDTTYTTSAYMVADLDSGDKIRNIHTDNGFVSVDSFTDGTGTTSVIGNKVSADHTPNDNNGTIYGADVRNHGYSMDGTDDYVDITSNSIVSSAATATLSAWIHPDVVNATNVGLVSSRDTVNGMEFRIENDEITCWVGNGTAGVQAATTDFNLVADTWYHILCTYDGTNIKMYKDGNVSSVTGSTSGTIGTTTSGLTIGSDNDQAANKFNGNIADVRIYNRALSASEVLQLSNDVDVPGAVGHWSLSSGAGDISGNANHGTVTGATLVGESASFDGVDDYVDAGDNYDFTENSYSIRVVIKPTDTGADGVLSKRTGGTFGESGKNGWLIRRSDQQLQVMYQDNNDAYTYATFDNALTVNEYNDVVVVFDDIGTGNIKCYVNSVEISGANTSLSGKTIQSNGDSFLIGEYPVSGTLNGFISDTRIYDRALTATEVTALYNQGHSETHQAAVGNLEKGLVGHWPLTTEGENVGSDLLSGWDFTSGWSSTAAVTGTTATSFTTNASGGLYKTIGMVAGKKYRLILDIASITSGTVTIQSGSSGTVIAGSLTAIENVIDFTYPTAAGSGDFYIKSSAAATITLNSFILKELTTADTTPADNHGTIYGADVRNHGYDFDGVDDSIDTFDAPFTAIGAGNMTLSAWIKNGSFSAQTILGDTSTYTEEWAISDADTIEFNLGEPSVHNYYDITQTLVVDTWYHLVTTKDSSGNIMIYVDGNDVTSGSPTIANAENIQYSIIGREKVSSDYFDGNISDVRIYDRLLSATEVSNLYLGDNTVPTVAHWPLSTGAGDISGNGNHGTVTGGAVLIGEGAEFDGTDDYVNVDTSIGTFSDLSEGTIIFWTKPENIGFFEIMFSASDKSDASSDISIVAHTTGAIRFIVRENDSASIDNLSGGSLVNGQWTQVAVTVDSGGFTIYQDGASVSSGTTQAFFNTVNDLDTLRVGNREHSSGNEYYYNGATSDVRLYDRALSLKEIQMLYDKGR